MKRVTLAVMVLSMGLVFGSCSGDSDNQMDQMREQGEQTTNETMDTMQQGVESMKDEFINSVQKQYDSLTEEMEGVEKAINDQSGELRHDIQTRWDDLKGQQTQLQENYESIKECSVENFEQLKTNIQDQLSNLQYGLAQIKQDLGLESS